MTGASNIYKTITDNNISLGSLTTKAEHTSKVQDIDREKHGAIQDLISIPTFAYITH